MYQRQGESGKDEVEIEKTLKTIILKYLLRKLCAHKDGLILRFIADDSTKYYGFKSKPPPMRHARIQRNYQLIVSGLSGEDYTNTLNKIVDNLKDGIEQAHKKQKNIKLQVVFALLFELQERATEPNIDIIADILATTLLLSDEDPNHIDKKVHQKKKAHITEILEHTPEQIIRLPEYHIFYDSGMSGDLLRAIQAQSKLTHEQINAILAHN